MNAWMKNNALLACPGEKMVPSKTERVREQANQSSPVVISWQLMEGLPGTQ